MSNLYLCTGKTAKNPFYSEEAGVKLWSVEEVCYVILHQEDYMVESLVTEKFIQWVRQELFLEELAEKLSEILSKNLGYIEYLTAIFDATDYVSAAQKATVSEKLHFLQSKTPTELGKMRTDRLMERKKYAAAIRMYQDLLATENYIDDRLRGNILHNIGTAFAGLFMYEKAAGYYRDAYRFNHSQESYRAFLHATRFVSEDTSYGKDVVFLEQAQVHDLERELAAIKGSGEAQIASNSLNRVLELRRKGGSEAMHAELRAEVLKWKREYVKMTSFEE